VLGLPCHFFLYQRILAINAERSAIVTMMHLVLLPDWNSLDSVRRAHSDLEAAGLVFFALLVVMEALAHNSKNERRKHLFDSIGIWFFAIAIFCEIGGFWYGQRNDDLSQQVIGSLDQKTKDAKLRMDGIETAASQLEKRLDNTGKSLDVVSGRADQIDAGLRETQWAFSMRTLETTEERDWIIKNLKQFHGKTVFVRSFRVMPDVDGDHICKIVVDLARSAGMNPVDQCSTLFPTTQPAPGLHVCGPDEKDALALLQPLSRIDVGTGCLPGDIPPEPGAFIVSVGPKALAGIGENFQTEDAEKRAALLKKRSKPSAKP
jgi:hypothetical protein